MYDDGDGSLKLALYKLRGMGTAELAVDRKSLRFPLPEQPFDEVRGPRYSPDCKRLYFSRRVGRDHDLFAYELETGALEVISAEPAFELYPEPTADGVYYVSSRGDVMNVYLRRTADARGVLVTQAITAHHRPVDTPHALLFGRLYGVGFRIHAQAHDRLPATRDEAPQPKLVAQAPEIPPLPATESYNGFSFDHMQPPTLVPLLDFEFDSARSLTGALRFQAGAELYIQDQLNRHTLLMRGYAGDQNSFLFDYDNSMLPVSLRVRGGFFDLRGLWVYSSGGSRFEQITDNRWGFLWGSLRLPLNLFYTAAIVGETTRDIGVTTGARSRRYDFGDPAYSRNLLGAVLSYDGIDRRDPTFRERDINKRGYRQFTLSVYYGSEFVNPEVARTDPTLKGGATPFFRAELYFSQFLALPPLARGFFDHSLQFDLNLGYISQDLTFFPFYGGGRLYSMAAPLYNASVGFAGYAFGGLRGETLANLGIAYRGPILRNLGWSLGPLYLNDVYFQVFTSWGNLWGYKLNGKRQIPFYNRAPNGNYVLGDVGVDIRLGHFIQQVETNVGTTLRAVYRLVPFSRCPDGSRDKSCLGPDGDRGFMFYFIVGGGF